MNEVITAKATDFVSFLPEVVWYLTQDGRDMWCRRPYAFFFSTSDGAMEFARTAGSEFTLAPIGIASGELVGEDGISALRGLAVTRIFIDPKVDPQTGDVFGKILRLEAVQ
jgi:hypothetical protein